MLPQEKYRQLRKRCGYTQKEWAEIVHLSQQTISAIERGQLLPTPKHLVYLQCLFGTTPEELGYEITCQAVVRSVADGQ